MGEGVYDYQCLSYQYELGYEFIKKKNQINLIFSGLLHKGSQWNASYTLGQYFLDMYIKVHGSFVLAESQVLTAFLKLPGHESSLFAEL